VNGTGPFTTPDVSGRFAVVEVEIGEYPVREVTKGDPRPGDSLNVSRIEFENMESAVRTNRVRIEKLEAQMDALQRELAELKKALRRG
jgi:hypothetical protein